jgi:hypothetical protein
MKPIARVADMEFSLEQFARTVFGLADGVFRFSMAFSNHSLFSFRPYDTVMECQAQLTRYKYIQDGIQGGPIQIIHELNSSTLPVYNLSWPDFNSSVFAGDLQREWVNDRVVGTKGFIGIMVSMLAGMRDFDDITLTAGRQIGRFRLNALAVILLTTTSVAVWTVAAGLLLWYTYHADCIATAADSGLLTAARHGPELGQLLQGGCNGLEIPPESALTVVRARRVGSHVEITSTGGEKVTEEQSLH